MSMAGIRECFLVFLLAGHSVRADRRSKGETKCLGAEAEDENRNAILSSQACTFNIGDSPKLAGYIGELTMIGAGGNGEVCMGKMLKNAEAAPPGETFEFKAQQKRKFVIKPYTGWLPLKDDLMAVKRWCMDEGLARNMTLKEMTSEASMMKYLAKVPQVATVWLLDVIDQPIGKCQTTAFLAMEGLLGGDLSSFVRGTLSVAITPKASAEIFFDAYMGVKTMHAYNVIHRDLKPANIMKVDGADKAKIIDFGSSCCLPVPVTPGVPIDDIKNFELCKNFDDSLVCKLQTNGKGNSLYWMPPEILKSTDDGHMPDKSDDLWAMGVIAYQMFVHQDTSHFFKWLFNSPHNEVDVMFAIVDEGGGKDEAGAFHKRIDDDMRLQGYPHMKEFIQTSLNTDPSQRELASKALKYTSTCANTAWCAEWMNMAAFPVSETLQSEQDHANNFRPDLTGLSTDSFDDINGADTGRVTIQ